MGKTILVGILLFLALGIAFSLPTGASVVAGTPVTLSSAAAGTANAWGGNITQVNLTLNTSTLHWQGFYGNVTAAITLGSGSNALKTWTVSTLKGQIYASQSNAINFANLSSTTFNTTYNVTLANVDNAFSFLSGANDATVNSGTDLSNPAFSIGPYSITANAFPLITTYNSTGAGTWQEVVLNSGNTSNTSAYVFTGILNASGNAYNNVTSNFQIIVPTSQLGNTSPTTYYFYGEAQ